MFTDIRSSRAFEEIAQQIRGELAGGRLKVGSRLPSERAMSQQFGLSRNTLREALRWLEHAGILRLQKGATGGAFIKEHSGEAVMTGLMDMYHLGAIAPSQLTEARIWLESVVVREACARATASDLSSLNQNIADAGDAHAKGDYQNRASIHLEFHRILTRMTGNPIMVTVMSGVLDVLRQYVDRIGDYDNAFVLTSRRRFMRRFVAGDADGAAAKMEASLRRLQKSYLSKADHPRVDHPTPIQPSRRRA
jgi:GntR family transcriptional repressor for pyruvate dehydrogenase complex